MPLSDVLPSQVSAEVALLSNSDRETERYIEQILMDVAVEVPFVMVPPELKVVRELLESKHGELMEMEAPTIEGILVTEVGREDAQLELTAVDGMRLRRESLIVSQVVADTPSVVGFAGGRTPKGVFWFVGEPLSRLGEKWLGNPFHYFSWFDPDAYHGGCPNDASTGNHGTYAISFYRRKCLYALIQMGYLLSKRLIPFLVPQGFMNGMDYFLRFWRSQEDSATENESQRKKVEDSEAALTLL